MHWKSTPWSLVKPPELPDTARPLDLPARYRAPAGSTQTLYVWSDEDDPDTLIVAAVPDTESPTIYAAARVVTTRRRVRVELSPWTTEDGNPVENRELTARAKAGLRLLRPA